MYIMTPTSIKQQKTEIIFCLKKKKDKKGQSQIYVVIIIIF